MFVEKALIMIPHQADSLLSEPPGKPTDDAFPHFVWVSHSRHVCTARVLGCVFPSPSASSMLPLRLAKESVIGVFELKCLISHGFLGPLSHLHSRFLCTVLSKLCHVSVSLEICNLAIKHDRSQGTGLKMKTAATQAVV